MTRIETDSDGRVTLPKEVRERFGERFRLVVLRNEIKLVPIPEDPFRALREAASDDLEEASMDELTRIPVDEGKRQAGEEVRD